MPLCQTAFNDHSTMLMAFKLCHSEFLFVMFCLTISWLKNNSTKYRYVYFATFIISTNFSVLWQCPSVLSFAVIISVHTLIIVFCHSDIEVLFYIHHNIKQHIMLLSLLFCLLFDHTTFLGKVTHYAASFPLLFAFWSRHFHLKSHTIMGNTMSLSNTFLKDISSCKIIWQSN